MKLTYAKLKIYSRCYKYINENTVDNMLLDIFLVKTLLRPLFEI